MGSSIDPGATADAATARHCWSRLTAPAGRILAAAVALPASRLALLGMAAGALLALRAGQDVNWDLSNYHFYDGWAALSGAAARDLWPAQAQSFFNPILPAVVFLLLSHLPPWAAAMSLGALQGLNYALVLLIARRMFSGEPNRPALAAAALAIGALAPMVRAEIGTTFGDNLASVPLLAAILALERARQPGALGWALAAGLLGGAAAGLKLTDAPYLAALAASGGWWAGGGRRSAWRLALFAAGAGGGGLALAGPWAWHLWTLTGNPLFPFFNDLFRSDWLPPVALQDRRFLPASLLDAVAYPVRWALGWHPPSEPGYRDLRFALVWLLAVLALVRPRGGPSGHGWLARFWVFGFALWLAQFAIQRYLVPLELLSGIVLLRLGRQALGRPLPAGLLATAVVVIALTTRAGDWGRRPFGPDWFGVAVPAALAGPDQMMVMLGGEPMAYVVPFFPPDARFVRLQGNLPVEPGTRLFDLAQAGIAGHRGPIASLAPAPAGPGDDAVLARFGLRRASGDCLAVVTRLDRLWACPLTHADRH